MNERQAADRLNQLADEMSANSCDFPGAAGRLGHSIDEAIAVPKPPGEPNMIKEGSATFAGDAAAALDRAKGLVAELRQWTLPAAWSGTAHVAASDALATLQDALERASHVFDTARSVFTRHADELFDAQVWDYTGWLSNIKENSMPRHYFSWTAIPSNGCAFAVILL